MKATDYSLVIVWSERDKAYLARAIELPGCIADGETREEAIKNVDSVIADWIDTAKELKRKVPQPMSDEDFERHARELSKRTKEQFQKAVNESVEKALSDIVPRLMEQFQQVFAAAGEDPQSLIFRRGTERSPFLLDPCGVGRGR